MKLVVHSQFMRFLLTGGIAALVNWLSRIFYSLWLDFTVAVALAFFSGLITGYILFRLFVFGAGQNSTARSVSYYVVINIAALALTWLTSVGLGLYLFPTLNFTWHHLEIAHAIGIAIPAISSYFGHKYLSFR